MNFKKTFESKFAKDSIITFGCQLLLLVSNFMINKVISNSLGVEGFGEFNIAKRTATVFGFVILMGLGISIPRFLAISKGKNDIEGQNNYALSGAVLLLFNCLFMTILLVLFKSSVASLVFGSTDYSYTIFSIVLFATGTSLSTFIFAFYRGKSLFYKYNYSQIVAQLLIILSVFIVKDTNFNTVVLLWGVVSNVFSIILIITSFKKYGVSAYFFNRKKTKSKTKIIELAKFGTPRIFGEFILFSYYLIPLIVINYKLGMETSGYFSASTGILQMFVPFFGYIGLILLPYVSENIANKNLGDADKKIKQLMVLYLLFGVIATTLVIVFTPLMIKIFYSEAYLNSVFITRIMVISLIPRSIYLLLRNPIDAISTKAYNSLNLLISFIFMIIIMLLTNSITGFAIAFVISDLVLGILSLISWNRLKRNYLLKVES